MIDDRMARGLAAEAQVRQLAEVVKEETRSLTRDNDALRMQAQKYSARLAELEGENAFLVGDTERLRAEYEDGLREANQAQREWCRKEESRMAGIIRMHETTIANMCARADQMESAIASLRLAELSSGRLTREQVEQNLRAQKELDRLQKLERENRLGPTASCTRNHCVNHLWGEADENESCQACGLERSEYDRDRG